MNKSINIYYAIKHLTVFELLQCGLFTLQLVQLLLQHGKLLLLCLCLFSQIDFEISEGFEVHVGYLG